MLVDLHQTVLLTAYTNTAVNNLLLKLLAYDVDFLRLGAMKNVNAKLERYYLCESNFSRVSDLAAFIESKQVFFFFLCVWSEFCVLRRAVKKNKKIA